VIKKEPLELNQTHTLSALGVGDFLRDVVVMNIRKYDLEESRHVHMPTL